MSQKELSPAPGYFLIRRQQIDGIINNVDFQNEHLMLSTWGVVVSAGPPVKKVILNGYGSFFRDSNSLYDEYVDVDVSVGDVVSFSHLHNVATNEDSIEIDGLILVPGRDIRCKISGGMPVGVGNNVAFKISWAADIPGYSRTATDAWDKGHIGDVVVLTKPKTAIPIEYGDQCMFNHDYYVVKQSDIVCTISP